MTEDQLEQDTLDWLADVGYTHMFGPDISPDGPSAKRANYQEVLLLDLLRDAIARLNPDIPIKAREDALQTVRDLGIPIQSSANRLFHQLLVGGVPVEYQKDGETRGDFARLIDWTNVAANEWLAINQFTIEGPRYTHRPDIILFINGLPLVLFELKKPDDLNTDIWMAYDQIQTYKEHIPEVFHYNEILVISDGSEARMGSLSADTERFMQWRTIDGIELDPLGQFRELETLIRGVLAPTYLLDYLRFFILFEDDGKLVKKIAGYHQFHAVRTTSQQIIPSSLSEKNHKGGVIWHTQGSGKSITMTCLTARVMQDMAMTNPTIVVITDRNNLDGQLFEVFSMAQGLLREQPIQAETRSDLRNKLANRPSGGIVFTTIQKFMPGEDEDTFPLLSDRSNIIVITDEAHRTQYNFSAYTKNKTGQQYQAGYAQHLRDALPNATFVAFTGTPISKADRDTRAVFGGYVHVYDIQQAQEDGATVPIYYESRLTKLSLNTKYLPNIDKIVDEIAEDKEDDEQAKLKSHWTDLEKIISSEPRIEAIAADLLAHFEERNKIQPGKAMFVAMSRNICVYLYDAIIRLHPDWHDPDPEKGAIKIVISGSASDKALLRPHIYNQQTKKRIEKRFKDPSDPLRLVIVRDMWLTGFDAPCMHTLYVDKPMMGHNLMQAIARVNRIFKDKQGGLVVDYIGIANELKSALKEYTSNNGRGNPIINIHEAYLALEEKINTLRAMLHGYDYSNFLTGGYKCLAGAANHVLGLEDGKKRFADNTLAMSKAFTLCCTLEGAKAIREEIAFIQSVNIILIKRDFSDKKKYNQEKALVIHQIISSAVISEQIVDVFEAVGLNKPNLGILDEAFLEKIRNLPEQNLAVDLMARLLEGNVNSKFSSNIIQKKKFSELLNDTIERYQNRGIKTAHVINEMIEIARQFRDAVSRSEQLGLSEDEIKFYDVLVNNESASKELSNELLKTIARELMGRLRSKISAVDWSLRENIRSHLRLIVKRILRKYKYPPNMLDATAELVLKQAETLGET